MFNQTILTPSEFVEWVNQTLEYAYPEVVLEGEVSGFSVNQNKFVFFDIKDESTAVSCFMMVWQLATQIEDGMQIRISARPKITNKGKFSLTVSKLQPIGEGDIKKAQLLLQQKLAKEGLFNSDRKRPVPQFPKKIGLISSKTAAGAKDFLTILENRWLGEVLFVNTNVQGENAGDQLVASIQYFNELNVPCDVVVMVRGGGSIEDLLPFSLEPVVRAVATSRTPMIVGIGHEQDVSLAELAADLRRLRLLTPLN